MSQASTREQIVVAADDLFYRHGFASTSFADIAKAVGISRGNFYHHFKSKDEILDAVIDARMQRTQGMLESWETLGSEPGDRMRSFIRILIRNQSKIMRHGCPVGTLCTELTKLDHPAQQAATGIFTLFRDWLRRQFVVLGLAEQADQLALHLLARSQGIATLAQAYGDFVFVEREVELLCEWVRSQECRK